MEKNVAKRKIVEEDVGAGPSVDLMPEVQPEAPAVPELALGETPPEKLDTGIGDGPVAMGEGAPVAAAEPAAEPAVGGAPEGFVDIRDAVIAGMGAEPMPILDGSKKAKKGDAITPEDRAQMAATVGKVMFDGLLEWGATRLGSSMTPEGHMQYMHRQMTAEALEAHQPLPPMGLPIDLNFEALIRSDLANAVVREISIVLTVRGGMAVPVRYAMGVTTLRETERAAENQRKPTEGEHVVVVLPATIGMTVAAQFASAGDNMGDKAGKWLKNHEEQIRMAVGALLAGSYAWAVVQDVRGSK
ncbi:MAG: hypothetical protein IPJ61_20075 [Tessaracoccus sp.]|uniref:hypothetical protein n=1 Tax=Tessaracoccus sp. TaxID=1971211 RepID=UPI001ED4788B|nr:hypothetical protein [Tessaracoccus sp.]MBK7823285.1 hypothetical protein [Tessaracoccus sp.]